MPLRTRLGRLCPCRPHSIPCRQILKHGDIQRLRQFFNKDSKHIILSHSRIFEDEQRKEARNARRQAAAAKPAAEAAPAAPQVEKTTLGDVTDLAALKAQLEKNEGAKDEPKTEE